MQFKTLPQRKNWKTQVEDIGFNFHTHESGAYWSEGQYFHFQASEIIKLEQAANELQQLCFDAIDEVIRKNKFSQMAIPENCVQPIIESWERQDPSMYGRFDFSYHGPDQIKLLEYNADTPTSLIESSIIQYLWLRDQKAFLGGSNVDQFNSLHESLVDFWKWYKQECKPESDLVHFTCLQYEDEDERTTEYIKDCCQQAGLQAKLIFLDEIGWDGEDFFDLEEEKIQHLFKLYPWEILRQEKFGQHLLSSKVRCLEPAWKMILSNKALLPVLWELAPGHPYLLPSFAMGHPMVGVWMVGEQACGLGIRQSQGLITDNRSQYVPHIIR